MTRTGKMGRLPLEIRHELNLRLQNGEQGKQLVAWLNSLPAVCAVLKEEFDGQPVAENNLSAWKTGGYLDWEKTQDTQQKLDAFMEKLYSLNGETLGVLPEAMFQFLSSRMVLELNRLDSLPDGEEKSSCFLQLINQLVLLQRTETHRQKLRLDSLKLEENRRRHEREERENTPMTPEEKQARINEIMGTE